MAPDAGSRSEADELAKVTLQLPAVSPLQEILHEREQRLHAELEGVRQQLGMLQDRLGSAIKWGVVIGISVLALLGYSIFR